MLRLASWSPARAWRLYHTHRVTDHMEFITKHNDRITIDPKTFRITRRVRKPICVQLFWMSAASAQTQRYTRLVLDQLDVVGVRCEVRHVLMPETGAQRIAGDLLKLMSANDTTYVLYGLSIGSYVWAEAMVLAARNPQYQSVMERLAAQVWDSMPADLKVTPSGIPIALFPNLDKRAFRWAIWVCDSWYSYYLKACYASVTAHYERAAHALLHTACRAPALFMHAEHDNIAPCEHARNIHDVWTKSGIKSTWKCWDKSDHVAHYLYHPQEYKALVQEHLQQHLPRPTV